MSSDVELRPDLASRHTRLRAALGRGYAGLAQRCVARRGRPAWIMLDGCNLLLRWSGERLPLPQLGDPDERVSEIAGFAPPGDENILTFADLAHAADTIYHYAVVQVTGGGVWNRVRPFEIITRTFDNAGDARGLMPNAPPALDARLLPGNKPLVSWWYSTVGQQVAPSIFRVYATDDVSAFDFNTPAASVNYADRQTRYEWTGAAPATDDVRYYTVRAESTGGVKSLIPRAGRCPAGDYDSVDKGRCPKIIVPAGPPDTIDELWPEVTS